MRTRPGTSDITLGTYATRGQAEDITEKVRALVDYTELVEQYRIEHRTG